MAASRTAQLVALYRALETRERLRAPLFTDPYAEAFLSTGLRFAAQAAGVPALRALLCRYADWRAPGARSSAIARTRYIDDVARRRAADGVSQLILLGAGFDCRAHRLPELRTCAVFELDREPTQSIKRARLGGLAPTPREDIRYVAVDFLRDDIAARLAAAGWDATARTLLVWEGVTNYLSDESVARVLAWVGRSAPGSALVFTYVHAGLLDGSISFAGGDLIMRNVRRLHEPWTFGLHPGQIGAYLARFGLALCEDLGADEYRRPYLRPSELGPPGYAFYRIALAETRGP